MPTIVLIDWNPNIPVPNGLVCNDDGKIPVISTYARNGLAVTRICTTEPWTVTHMKSGKAITFVSYKQYANKIVDALADKYDWNNLGSGEALSEWSRTEGSRINSIIDSVLPPPCHRKLNSVEKILESDLWDNAVLEGPMDHIFKEGYDKHRNEYKSVTEPAYKITKGTAVAWIKVSSVKDWT